MVFKRQEMLAFVNLGWWHLGSFSVISVLFCVLKTLQN